MANRPELKIANGSLAGKRFKVGEGGVRLGRSSSNDIHVPDEELSRNHCLFEPSGDSGIKVTDLASANGTYVNGKQLGNDPLELKAGDRIEVGKTLVDVVGDEPQQAHPTGGVDLGFDKPGGGKGATRRGRAQRRSPVANVLWVIAGISIIASAYLALNLPTTLPKDQRLAGISAADETPELREMYYEKVEADSNGIFRYELTLSPDRVRRVCIDDVPNENRHITKSKVLDDAAFAELSGILAWDAVKGIDREYAGAEPDPPALDSKTLRLVYSTRPRSITIVNTQEPEAFKSLREKLETFSKSELGVWAMQYSRDKLIALALDSIALGRSKWEDRDVQYGNLAESVKAYREAFFYLETINPKPDFAADARQGLDRSVAELDRRYSDQRFQANRAINLGQWDVAKKELGVLMEMIPDRQDDRHREAMAKLLDVEKRIKDGGR